MRSGRHFLQIPGPTKTPDRILRAMHRAVIDHRARALRTVPAERRRRLSGWPIRNAPRQHG